MAQSGHASAFRLMSAFGDEADISSRLPTTAGESAAIQPNTLAAAITTPTTNAPMPEKNTNSSMVLRMHPRSLARHEQRSGPRAKQWPVIVKLATRAE